MIKIINDVTHAKIIADGLINESFTDQFSVTKLNQDGKFEWWFEVSEQDAELINYWLGEERN